MPRCHTLLCTTTFLYRIVTAVIVGTIITGTIIKCITVKYQLLYIQNEFYLTECMLEG